MARREFGGVLCVEDFGDGALLHGVVPESPAAAVGSAIVQVFVQYRRSTTKRRLTPYNPVHEVRRLFCHFQEAINRLTVLSDKYQVQPTPGHVNRY
jgi:hypothetical protein